MSVSESFVIETGVQPPIWSSCPGNFVRFRSAISLMKNFSLGKIGRYILFPSICHRPELYIGDFTRNRLQTSSLSICKFHNSRRAYEYRCNHWMWHSRWIFMPHLNVVARYYRPINSLDRSASSYAEKKRQKRKEKKKKKRDATLELKTLKYLL